MLGRPLRFAETGDSTVLTAEPVADDAVLLPVAVALAYGRRPTLLLWRQGQGRGYQLFRRSRLQDAHVWGSQWDVPEVDPDLDEQLADDLRHALAPAVGDAQQLAKVLKVDGADIAALRSVLRRPAGPQVLTALCEKLNIDIAVAAVVEGGLDPAALSGSALAEPSTMTFRALIQAATAPRPTDPWFVRMGDEKPWWYRLSNVLWVPIGILWAERLWSGSAVSAVRPATHPFAQPPPGQ